MGKCSGLEETGDTQPNAVCMLSEVSQKEKARYHVTSPVWDVKYDTNEPTCETETDSENKLVAPRLRGMRGRSTGSSGLADPLPFLSAMSQGFFLILFNHL